MRLLEYKIDYHSAIPTEYAKQMFDHQLMENYGHAGTIYIQWVLNNLEEVRSTLKVVQIKIDRELNLTQRERFWSAEVAANITGGMIARRLKIIDWDMKRIYAWATGIVAETLKDVEPPPTSTTAILGDYLNRNIHSILVVNDKVDKRSNMEAVPEMEPRGPLYIRYEPDTKKLFVDHKHLREDCVRAQINFKQFIADMKKIGAYIGSGSKRLSKGMKITTLPVYAAEFDTAVSHFFDMGTFVSENGDAD
jgi:hypothetical protein